MNQNIALHLIWKDWHQVKRPFWLVLAMLGLLQLILVVSYQWDLKYVGDILPYNPGFAFRLAFSAPIFLAAACSAMLIGQERQEGVWSWACSLPVSWRQSLVSKFGLWILLSLAASTALSILACLGPPPNFNNDGVLSSSARTVGIMAVNSSAIALESVLLFSLILLLLAEPLLAMLIASLLVFAVHMLLNSLTNQFFWGFLIDPAFDSRYDLHYNRSMASAIYAAYIGVMALVSGAAYRWRWQTGQYASPWPVWGRRAVSSVRPNTKWRSVFTSVVPPSETRAIRANAFRSGLAARTVILAAALVGEIVCLLDDTHRRIFTTCIAASLFFGLTTFAFDHPKSRHRFWAIRGVNPGQFFYSRVIQSALPCILLFLIGVGLVSLPLIELPSWLDWVSPRSALLSLLRTAFTVTLPIMIICYSTGVLASICFPNAIAAFAVAFAKLFFVTFLFFSVMNSNEDWFQFSVVPYITYLLVSGLILFVASRRLTSKWIVHEPFQGPFSFLKAEAMTIVLAGLAMLVMTWACHEFMLPR